jgi:hypothetical protein
LQYVVYWLEQSGASSL